MNGHGTSKDYSRDNRLAVCHEIVKRFFKEQITRLGDRRANGNTLGIEICYEDAKDDYMANVMPINGGVTVTINRSVHNHSDN